MTTARDLQPKVTRSVRERAPHQHDRLCLDTTTVPGQKFCWCRCPKCWRSEGLTRVFGTGRKITGGVPKGTCICLACPCVAQLQENIRICSMPV